MKLSRKCDYALRALLVLATREEGEYVGIAAIAKAEEIPLRYLEQVMLALKNAGIVSSKTGAGGGVRLGRDPEEVTLLEVVRIIDGPVAPIRCVSHTAYEKCPREGKCALRPVLSDVRDAIAEILDKFTLAEVARRSEAKGRCRETDENRTGSPGRKVRTK